MKMKNWLKISLILCTYGFFRELRPSEPFVTEFLSGEWRNITSEQVNRYIYPLGTYSYLAQLIVVFLITDILRYKPIIILSSCVGIVLWSLLLWTYTLLGLQIVQICYGMFMSAEVAYYTYIYAKVDREKYQKVTGHTRAAILCGRFVGCSLAQILVSQDWLDFRELNYISLASQIVSLFFALMLPSVGESLYFYTRQSLTTEIPNNVACKKMSITTLAGDELNLANVVPIDEHSISEDFQKPKKTSPRFSWNNAKTLFFQHFYGAYSNFIVVLWSIWWALALCGYLQVSSYIQLLWKSIEPNHENLYNGGVDALLSLLAAASSFGAGFLNSARFQQWDIWLLTLCSLLEGVFLIGSAVTSNIWISYVFYILFGTLYAFMITIASATVAKNLIEDSFGLIFGINTFVALALQSIFTVVVISDEGFGLDSKGQFLTFGGYFIVLSILYAIAGIILKIRMWKNSSAMTVTSNNDSKL